MKKNELLRRLSGEKPENREGAYPVPEMIREGEWEIKKTSDDDIGASVNIPKRKMVVPLTADPIALRHRSQQMAHAKFSPDKAPQSKHFSDTNLRACEAMRMQALQRKAGIDHYKAATYQPQMPMYLNDDSEAASKLVAAYGTDDQAFMENVVQNGHRPKAQKVANKVKKMIWDKESPTIEDTKKAARYMTEQLGTSEWDNYRPQEIWGVPWDAYDEGEEDYEVEDELQRLAIEASSIPEKMRDKARWGKISDIEHPPLDHDLLNRRTKLYRKISTAEGAIPRHMHRYTIDSQIFGRKRRTLVGTVLLDTSGSMHIDKNDVKKIIETIPGSLIAIYSGHEDGRTGKMRIIAKDGKHCAPGKFKFGSGFGANLIDGPALEWLARQRTPRIWVSDGYVTGVDEDMSHAIAADAVRIMRQNGIRRIEDLQTLRALLTAGY